MLSALTADLSLMRELNRALVLQLIRRKGRISRADIAKHTKLSRSTVSSIINDLIDDSLVTEKRELVPPRADADQSFLSSITKQIM